MKPIGPLNEVYLWRSNLHDVVSINVTFTSLVTKQHEKIEESIAKNGRFGGCAKSVKETRETTQTHSRNVEKHSL